MLPKMIDSLIVLVHKNRPQKRKLHTHPNQKYPPRYLVPLPQKITPRRTKPSGPPMFREDNPDLKFHGDQPEAAVKLTQPLPSPKKPRKPSKQGGHGAHLQEHRRSPLSRSGSLGLGTFRVNELHRN